MHNRVHTPDRLVKPARLAQVAHIRDLQQIGVEHSISKQLLGFRFGPRRRPHAYPAPQELVDDVCADEARRACDEYEFSVVSN